jgi:TfoX/Sxy family transcriptional regulator of competence genes
VAYDEALAARIRQLVAGEPGLTEQKMFGGIAFLVGGNMALTASGRGGIMVRVDPDESDALTVSTPATVVVMRGREMRGWLRVDAEHLRTRPGLAAWVERSVAFARSLPVKQ